MLSAQSTPLWTTPKARKSTERYDYYTDQPEHSPPLKENSQEEDQPCQQKGRSYHSREYPDHGCVSVGGGGIEKRHHIVFELMQLGSDYAFDDTRQQLGPLDV
jgi:hypothetical protein